MIPNELPSGEVSRAIPERIRRLAAKDFDRDGWLDMGREIARDQGVVAWEAAFWTLYGPEALGSWAFQYLGDGVDPADDPDAIFPQSGATLKNYRTTAKRFPPMVLFQTDDTGRLRWPDVIPQFTIFQDLTPMALPDDFVFRVLDAVQDSYDDRRAWDEGGREGDQPSVVTRADVRRAVRSYRDNMERDDVDADPDTAPAETDDEGLERATAKVVQFPDRGNPFESGERAERSVNLSFRRVVDLSVLDGDGDGRAVVFRGVGPVVTEVAEDDPSILRIRLDRDMVREVVLEALDALPGASGIDLADWIADHLDGEE